MKLKILMLFVIFIFVASGINLFSQVNYDTSHILISSTDYDIKNPQFDKTASSVNYQIKDCILAYEKWISSNDVGIGIRFMTYNTLGPEIVMSGDKSMFPIINPAVAYHVDQSSASQNNVGAVAYQGFNGFNWDVYFTNYNQITWSLPIGVATSSADETEPSIVSYKINNTVNYLFAYKKGDDIYIRNYINGSFMNEINVTSDVSAECVSPELTRSLFTSGIDLYLAYQQKITPYFFKISFHKLNVYTNGDVNLGERILISQTNSQNNIRFSNGETNTPILNYDYDTLGNKNFYSAMIKFNQYSIFNQTANFGGDNIGGTGSSHGDITSDILSGYSIYSWIRKTNDSTQIIIMNQYPEMPGRYYVGNPLVPTFVNMSTKLVFDNTKYRIRILWEKKINGKTALIESFRDQDLTSISNSNIIPKEYSLSQNYPNPFNPMTVINYELRVTSNAKLKVFDVLGNEISTLVNEKQTAGSYSVTFDGSNFPSGVYFYKLDAGNFSETKRMILLK
ncbi:MAG: T9SS type A sorting domain-containing protein [Ignavibacteria bacterium]